MDGQQQGVLSTQQIKEQQIELIENVNKKLTDFLETAKQLKSTFDLHFKKLIQKIEQWILQITNQQDRNNDFQKDVFQICQKCYNDVEQLINEEIQIISNLKKHELQFTFRAIINYQEQINNFQYDSEQSKDIICKEHNRQITHIDCNNENNSLKKLFCSDCEIIGGAIPFKKFILQLNSINQQRLQKINSKKQVLLTKVDQVKTTFIQHQNNYNKQINNVYALLDQQFTIIMLKQFSNQRQTQLNQETIYNIIQEQQKQTSQISVQQEQQLLENLQQKFIQCISYSIIENKDKSQHLKDQIRQLTSDNNLLQRHADEISVLKCQIQELIQQNEQLSQEKKKLMETNSITNKQCHHVKTQNSLSFNDQQLQTLNAIPQQLQENDNVRIISQYKNFTKEQEYCYAHAFNEDNSLLACGLQNKILIFDLGVKNLDNLLITLCNHSDKVYTILFSRKSNWFLSAGRNGQIICWKENKKNEWVGNQQQIMHSNWIWQLVLNKKEDELLSCSSDSTIQVWKVNQEQNQLIHLYKLKEGHNQSVYSICQNLSEDILLSTGYDTKVIMWKKNQQNYLWEQAYSQQFNIYYSYRICFVEEEYFVLQPNNQCVMHVFKLVGEKFVQINNVSLQLGNGKHGKNDDSLVPMVYNSDKKLLFNKHDQFIFIIEYKQEGTFQLKEQIDCYHATNFGTISKNFEYIANWDNKKKKIRLLQVRQ